MSETPADELAFEVIRRFAAIGEILYSGDWMTRKALVETLGRSGHHCSKDEVTKCIARVEKFYDVARRTYVDSRTGLGVCLTLEGKKVSRMFKDVVDGYLRVQHLDVRPRRQLRIASPNFITLHGLAPVLGLISGKLGARSVQLRVIETTDTWKSVTLLRDGIVDVVLDCVVGKFEADNIVVHPLGAVKKCEFRRMVLIPKNGGAAFSRLPAEEFVTMKDLDRVPLVTVLTRDETERMNQSSQPRIAVDTLEAARLIAMQQKYAVLTLNWSRVVGEDWKQYFTAKWLATPTAQARTKGVTSLPHLHDTIKVVAMHLDYPAPGRMCGKFIQYVEKRFDKISASELIEDLK